eukprot:m.106106 g.106106  ORF g.106106 m.106106 type:complete len:424 (+) comp37250_c0_seq14:96-1367(+)
MAETPPPSDNVDHEDLPSASSPSDPIPSDGDASVSHQPDTNSPASHIDSKVPSSASFPSHVFDKTWSNLKKEEVIDKIKGAIYGQALGDAIGLATEFMSKKDAKRMYGKGPSSFKDICNDFHRSRWEKGDWTDDTDQMLLIMIGATEADGTISEKDFAKRLVRWMQEGYRELNDQGGCGVGRTVLTTIITKGFKENPHLAARETWETSGRYLAANGAVMRTSILGVMNFKDIDTVIENTKRICLTTHTDPRCLASCVAVTAAIAFMLQGCLEKPGGMEDLIKESTKRGKACLSGDVKAEIEIDKVIVQKWETEMENHLKAKSWGDLDLESRDSMGYTFKTLGAGFYGFEHFNDYWKAIMELIMEAGDADTNASVCGALLGCKLGYKKLPHDRLRKMPHIKWLDEKVEKFLKMMGLDEEKTSTA